MCAVCVCMCVCMCMCVYVLYIHIINTFTEHLFDPYCETLDYVCGSATESIIIT